MLPLFMLFFNQSSSIDWLIACSIDWLHERLIDFMIEWLIDCVVLRLDQIIKFIGRRPLRIYTYRVNYSFVLIHEKKICPLEQKVRCKHCKHE